MVESLGSGWPTVKARHFLALLPAKMRKIAGLRSLKVKLPTYGELTAAGVQPRDVREEMSRETREGIGDDRSARCCVLPTCSARSGKVAGRDLAAKAVQLLQLWQEADVDVKSVKTPYAF